MTVNQGLKRRAHSRSARPGPGWWLAVIIAGAEPGHASRGPAISSRPAASSISCGATGAPSADGDVGRAKITVVLFASIHSAQLRLPACDQTQLVRATDAIWIIMAVQAKMPAQVNM